MSIAARRTGRVRERFAQWLQDVRLAVRTLRRAPAFVVAVTATLVIVIGLNTAVFSVVNAVLLRPLAYPDADRLVWISTYDDNAQEEIVPRFDFRFWRAQAHRTFDRMVAYRSEDVTLGTTNGAVQARTAFVSDDFWPVIGPALMLGRGSHEGEPPGLVLSHGLFAREFGADASIVGRTVTLNGQSVTVIGVTSPTFRFQLVPPPRRTPDRKDVEAYIALDAAPPDLQRSRGRTVSVVARLATGATLDQARAELENVRQRIAATSPLAFLDRMPLEVTPLQEKLVGGARRILWLLLGAVILVLMIGCVNIANLQLARLSTRQLEMATRIALGAGRGRLVRQLITESVATVAIGGIAGVVVASWATRGLVSLFPTAVPRLSETATDARVLTFGIAASLVTAVVFGVVPALSAWRTDPARALGRSSAAESPSSMRGRNLLVAVEIAAAVVLLFGAGLLLRSAAQLNARPPDFHPDSILVLKVPLSGAAYADRAIRDRYIEQVLERVSEVSGITAAGVTPNYPIRSGFFARGRGPLRPGELRTPTTLNATSAGYARTMGLRVVAGRWLTDQETQPVVVLNESLARREFGSRSALGQQVVVEGIWLGQRPGYSTVVGIVSDVKDSKLDAAPEPQIYMPYAHVPLGQGIAILARTGTDPNAVAPALRKAVGTLDPSQAVYDMQTLQAILDDSVAPRRLTALLLEVFGATAVLLVLVGLHGVMAFFVGQRTREIGVRLAVGATARDVCLMIIRRGVVVTSGGLVSGLVAAIVTTRLLRTALYEVSPTDPTTLAVVIATVGAMSLLACGSPALRATWIDPARTLRGD